MPRGCSQPDHRQGIPRVRPNAVEFEPDEALMKARARPRRKDFLNASAREAELKEPLRDIDKVGAPEWLHERVPLAPVRRKLVVLENHLRDLRSPLPPPRACEVSAGQADGRP